MLSVLQDVGYLLSNCSGVNTDSLNKLPREKLFDQEFGLFAFLDLPGNIRTGPTIRRNSCPVDLA